MSIRRLGRFFLSLMLGCTVLAGCARVPLAPYQPSMENLQLLKASGISPVSVGRFALAPGKPSGIDVSVSIRSNVFYSPNEGSFARFLEQSLITELRTGGKYAPESPAKVRGWLLENRLDASGVKDNTAVLSARFIVDRDGQVLYDKALKAQSTWDTEFLGVVAVPAGISEYAGLFRKLFSQLFSDTDFQKATREGNR